VLSIRSVPRLYNEEQLQLRESGEPACEDLCSGAEERPLLEEVTEERSQNTANLEDITCCSELQSV
jgi:hypothetical protein